MSGGGGGKHKRWLRAMAMYEGGEETSIDAINAAIKTDTFAEIRAVACISFEAEFVGRWSEGCRCHEEDTIDRSLPKRRRILIAPGSSGATCIYKCCRAPELAASEGLCQQMELMVRNRFSIMDHVGSASSEQKRIEILRDWNTARSRLWCFLSELQCWLLLPYYYHYVIIDLPTATRVGYFWAKS